MVRARTWTVEIHITEHEDGHRTCAVPATGDDLATARALADLAYKALDSATDDVKQFTHRPMRMLS